jgi:uncharacterized protein (DUF1810 family)
MKRLMMPMPTPRNAMDRDDVGDRFDLARFVAAQEVTYERALAEPRAGSKRSHWMWYVFPRIDGLGHSAMARRYAIRGLDEARAYARHPGTRSWGLA